ncbi:MAG: hypothetical protein Q9162_005393 [Coniocarpon cinnabarinum]
MPDAVSIAGLALASLDELLRFGQRTAELASDIRCYDEDFNHVYEQIRHQTWKCARLKQFLFQESSVYGGASLIEKLDEDAHDQINVALEDSVNVIGNALKLLQRFCSPPSPFAPSPPESRPPNQELSSEDRSGFFRWPSSGRSNPNDISLVLRRTPSRSPLNMIRWSFRDKKRASTLVRRFTDLNARLLEKVQFLTLSSAIGIQLQPLRHWEKDTICADLGFNNEASLKLSNVSDLIESADFELQPTWLENCEQAPISQRQFAVFEWDGISMLQENCLRNRVESTSVDPQTRHRVNRLAELLEKPKESLANVLPCRGWTFLPQAKQIAYLFEIRSGLAPSPRSLLRMLSDSTLRPSLSTRMKLAHHLARNVAQLHMVKWVHESIRSENILFFPHTTNADQPSEAALAAVDIQMPYIFGFEFSRPDSYFSAGFIDACPERDVYRHPVRQGQPLTTFKEIHDIYSLGVVLLEIAVWRPAVTLEKNHFAHAKDGAAIATHLLKHAQKHVDTYMGERYKDMVLRCLTGNFDVVDDTAEDVKLQQAFRTQVVEVLEQMANTV